jgi:hypothetical protein
MIWISFSLTKTEQTVNYFLVHIGAVFVTYTWLIRMPLILIPNEE